MRIDSGQLTVAFQRAVVSDAPLLAATRRKVWAATYRGIYPDEMIDSYDLAFYTARDEKRISNPSNTVWLAVEGDECVGYLYVGPPGYGSYKDFDFCLNSLYFLPPWQGRGLGRQAMALVREECRARGYDRFFCGCNAHNKKARAFYEHMGGILGAEHIGHENKAEDQVFFEFQLFPVL